ncbi:MAG TPA: DUF202 domain-containing protein [Rubrobacteraceae bacterium]|nr:DUF202 domain-containing protein [Rubrobacteraceae bacterium]
MRPEDDAGGAGAPQKRGAETREHLANERTLLSWVRTGIGLISIGLVVERAGVLEGGGPGGAGCSGCYRPGRGHCTVLPQPASDRPGRLYARGSGVHGGCRR